MTGLRTKRTCAHAAIADAASFCSCSRPTAAPQRKSPKQSLQGVDLVETETKLSPLADPTTQTRTNLPFAANAKQKGQIQTLQFSGRKAGIRCCCATSPHIVPTWQMNTIARLVFWIASSPNGIGGLLTFQTSLKLYTESEAKRPSLIS